MSATQSLTKIWQHASLLLRGKGSFADLPRLSQVALRKGRRGARRSISSVVFALDTRLRKAISRTSRRPQHIESTVIWPGSPRRFYFTNVKAGRYTFQISHQDSLVFDNRRALIARFDLSNDRPDDAVIREMELQSDDCGRAFSYMGAGQQHNGRYSQAVVVNVPNDQRWLRISVSSPYDRLINMDRIAFGASEGDHLRSRVEGWLSAEAADTEFLLYADIDLNVVDGSSIWLSSMASLLCGLGRCILVSKRNVGSEIILSNVRHRQNLTVLTPSDLKIDGALTVTDGIEIVRALDSNLARIRNVVVRGLEVGVMLHETRQFRDRSSLYLTDFYKVTRGERVISDEQRRAAAMCALQAGTILVQTHQIKEALRAVTDVDISAFELPPPIPDELPEVTVGSRAPGSPVRIGYAGKITPDWGITELLEWAEALGRGGMAIELHIVANKITETGGEGPEAGFKASVLETMARIRATHYQDLNRESAMDLMSRMDYVWCWRPSRLEDATLELSTKLIEMVASGARCICYPNSINRATLGEDYPYFVGDFSELERVLSTEVPPSECLMTALRTRHSMAQVRASYWKAVLGPKVVVAPRRICVAGHDLKFMDPYVSHLKAIGHEVLRDDWQWGAPGDLGRSEKARDWAETVICEWGLANAVWYSRNLKAGQDLYIRIHAQEVQERAQKFGAGIQVGNVTKFIFVSDDIRRRAIEMFGWPLEKTVVIPNFVLTNEYLLSTRSAPAPALVLGMVGIVPRSKRFDRAVETLAGLRARGVDAMLYVKGHRPEDLAFMRAPGRKQELQAYDEVYQRIQSDPTINGRVVFEPWGNDVSLFYRSVDYILSPSDHESFHYALADGILSGCQPVIWARGGLDELYSREWVVEDVSGAVDRIVQLHAMQSDERAQVARDNRALMVARFGHEKVFRELSRTMGLDDGARNSAGYRRERGVFLDATAAEGWDQRLKEHAREYLAKNVTKFRSIAGGGELGWLDSLFMPPPGFPMVPGVWLSASCSRSIVVPASAWGGVRMDLAGSSEPWQAVVCFGDVKVVLKGEGTEVTALLGEETRRVKVRRGAFVSVSLLQLPGHGAASIWLTGAKIRAFRDVSSAALAGGSCTVQVIGGRVGFIYAQAWGEAERNDLGVGPAGQGEEAFEVPCSPYWLREWEERARRLWHLSLAMRVCADALRGDLPRSLGVEVEDLRDNLTIIAGLQYHVLVLQSRWRPSSGERPGDGPWERGNWSNGFLLGAYGLAVGVMADLEVLPDNDSIAAIGYERGMRWLEPPTDGRYTSTHFPSLRHWVKRSTNHGIVILASALVGYAELERLDGSGSAVSEPGAIEQEFWELLAEAFADGAYLEGVGYAQFSLQEAITLFLYRFQRLDLDWQAYIKQYPYLAGVKEFLYQSAYPGSSKPYVHWGDCQVLDWKQSIVNFMDTIASERAISIVDLISSEDSSAQLLEPVDTEVFRAEPLSLPTQALPVPASVRSAVASRLPLRVVPFPATGLVHAEASNQNSSKTDWRTCILATRLHATHNVDHDLGSFFLATGDRTVVGEVSGRGAWRHSTVCILGHGLEDGEDPFSCYGGANKDGLIDRSYGGKLEEARIEPDCHKVTIRASHGLVPDPKLGPLVPEFVRDFLILGDVSPLLLVITRFTAREGFTPFVQFVLPSGGEYEQDPPFEAVSVVLNGSARLYLPTRLDSNGELASVYELKTFKDRGGACRLIEAYSAGRGPYLSVACIAPDPDAISMISVEDRDQEGSSLAIQSVHGSYVLDLPLRPSLDLTVTGGAGFARVSDGDVIYGTVSSEVKGDNRGK